MSGSVGRSTDQHGTSIAKRCLTASSLDCTERTHTHTHVQVIQNVCVKHLKKKVSCEGRPVSGVAEQLFGSQNRTLF